MHPLDTPIWTALTSHQANLALSSGLARRFPPEMAAHGAMAALIPPAYQELARLAPEPVNLWSRQKLALPMNWKVLREVNLIQMVLEPGDSLPSRLAEDAELVELSNNDVPEMMRLYELTRPGRKMAPRIQQLGKFFGVRVGGALVSMGGLRMHVPGHREITTVATDVEHLGKGYATAVVTKLVETIRAAGERPFLTVRDDNQRAIKIYERLGFKERTRIQSVTVVSG